MHFINRIENTNICIYMFIVLCFSFFFLFFFFCSHKRQRIDRSGYGETGHSSKPVYIDANNENRDPHHCDYLNEMGLAMIDTDESSSNHSSSRNTIVSSQPSSVAPASAFSLAMSEHFADTLQSLSEDSENECQATMLAATDEDSSVDNFSTLKHERSDRSDIMADFILSSSDSNSSDGQTKSVTVLESLQDNTPANLVPFSRTTLSMINAAASSAIGGTGNTFRVFDGSLAQPEVGRPIRNTSLVKVATNNSAQKHKGRSPLANVTCNSHHNSSSNSSVSSTDSKKKIMDALNEDSFFMYRKEDPRIYKGDGECVEPLYI